MTSVMREKPKFKPRSSSNVVSSFIRKTYELLEDQRFPDIVDWNVEGTVITIKKPVEFGQKVLPTYFKHNNLTSFVRQLNMYDFHKRRTQQYDHVYYHDLFQRGKKHLLKEIKRKNQDHTLASIQKAIESLENVQGNIKQDSSSNAYENQLLKKLNKDALCRITTLESKVKDLSVQNQALWNQITEHNQKESILISFIANFMKQRGISGDELPKMLIKELNLQAMQNTSDKDSDLQCSETALSAESTENSTSSPPSQDQVDWDKLCRNATSVLPKTESMGTELGSLPPLDLDERTNPTTQANSQYFNLESQYMKAFANVDAKVNESAIGEVSYGGEEPELLGKRKFVPEGESYEEVYKMVKREASTGQDVGLFFQRYESLKDDIGSLNIKNLNSLEIYADCTMNSQNPFVDLMDFTQIS